MVLHEIEVFVDRCPAGLPQGLSTIYKRLIVQVISHTRNLYAIALPFIRTGLWDNFSSYVEEDESAVVHIGRIKEARYFVLTRFAGLVGDV
jgi:hypothetical protein